jgi:hypothetical protein
VFRILANQFRVQLGLTPQAAAEYTLSRHPMELARYIEQVWIQRPAPQFAPQGLEVPGTLQAIEGNAFFPPGIPTAPAPWPHLIYSFMVEQTRAVPIFARVVRGFSTGEELGVADEASLRWLRTTEALFFSQQPPYQIFSTASWLRPDPEAAKRNVLYRVLGMDLSHGADDGAPYPYAKPKSANREFALTFEELQREVWRGIENLNNFGGAKPTDDAAIQELTRTLYEMLNSRRQNGNLNRDELAYVSLASWFHLTLSYDTAIVDTLGANASSPEERPMKVGAAVGLPAHSRSGSFFQIADPVSQIIRFIEAGVFNAPGAASALYTAPALRDAMREIIVQWSLATGKDMKARKVAITSSTLPGQTARPVPAPRRASQPASVPAGARDGQP